MNKIAIFDLDDTLSDTFHRDYIFKKLLGQYQNDDYVAPDIDINNPEYIKFYKLSKHDAPIISNIKLARHISNIGIDNVILTGRSDVALNETVDWLERYHVPYSDLIMRPHNDVRRSHNYKRDEIEKLMENNQIVFAIDDNEHNVNMFRSKGILSVHIDKSKILSIN